MKRQDSIDAVQHRTVVWALVLSVAIHAVLLLLSVLFPVGSLVTAVEVDSPQSELRFTFDQPPAEPTTEDPEQDSRFLPVEPQPSPQIPVPQPPSVAEIRESGPPSEVVDASSAETARETVEEQAQTPDPALAADPQGQVRPSPPADRFSMERAMRDFGEALERAPRPPAGQPRSQGVASNVFEPDLSQIPSVGYGMGNLVFESRDYDWNDYGRQVYMAIWRAWHNRLYVTYDEFEKWAAGTGNWRLNHQLRLHFVIEGNGEVTGVTLDDGSSCRPLDDSAIEALEEVILPPLPADFPRDREVVRARFVGQGPIRAMPANLRMLKRAGYF